MKLTEDDDDDVEENDDDDDLKEDHDDVREDDDIEADEDNNVIENKQHYPRMATIYQQERRQEPFSERKQRWRLQTFFSPWRRGERILERRWS